MEFILISIIIVLILLVYSLIGTKNKEDKNDNFDKLVISSFTRENKFYDVIYDIVEWSPGKEKLKEYISKVKGYSNYEKEFYLHRIRSNTEIFKLDKTTVDYLELLIALEYKITKANSLIFSSNSEVKEYIRNQLFDSAHILRELDLSLRGGVPITNDSIQKSAQELSELLDEVFEEHFHVNTESLKRELIMSQEIRIKKQQERDLIESTKKTS